jgi:hypothetical protein
VLFDVSFKNTFAEVYRSLKASSVKFMRFPDVDGNQGFAVGEHCFELFNIALVDGRT